ncbi:MAG: hypothetical protein M1835_000297 [Candelina submexicana]|nr:MAG: hypothetical protein M1835_000297 [Candelina submexicana]
MDKTENAPKEATSSGSQFEQGHKIPIQHQTQPGSQRDMGPQPTDEKLPTEDGGYAQYKAAGKLQGKKAIITGGDSGIGRAIAIMYAMEGADSLIAYLPEEEQDANDTVAKVEKYGQKCYKIAGDLRDKDFCSKVVKKALDKMGGINILVNNAAYQMVKKSIGELSEDQWLKTFDTNIHPFFYLAKYSVPHMTRGDTVINNASINAYIGRPDLLDYTSTKGAIISFTRGLANQMVSHGIRVNAVAPGPVWTPLIPATMDDDAQDSFSSPLGRPAQPSEIATSFVFLASTDSSMFAGQTLHPNGGVIVNG